MAYFEKNNMRGFTETDRQYTRRFSDQDPDPEDAVPAGEDGGPEPWNAEYADYDGYDDGFDTLNDDGTEPEDELSEEERLEESRMKFRFAANIGNLLAVILGTVVILVLVALLISMLNFLHSDISQSFSLWSTKL